MDGEVEVDEVSIANKYVQSYCAVVWYVKYCMIGLT